MSIEQEDGGTGERQNVRQKMGQVPRDITHNGGILNREAAEYWVGERQFIGQKNGRIVGMITAEYLVGKYQKMRRRTAEYLA